MYLILQPTTNGITTTIIYEPTDLLKNSYTLHLYGAHSVSPYSNYRYEN